MAEVYFNMFGKPQIASDEGEYADLVDLYSGNTNRAWGAGVDRGDVLDVEKYLNLGGGSNFVDVDEDDRRRAMMETSPYNMDTYRDARKNLAYLDLFADLMNEEKEKEDIAYSQRNDVPELSAVSPVQRADWDNEDYQDDVELGIYKGAVRPSVRKALSKAVDVAKRLEEPLLGKENENYNGGEDVFDEIPDWAYWIPPVYVAGVANDLYTGKRSLGALDLMALGWGGKSLANGARFGVRGAKAFGRGFRNGIARRRREAQDAVKMIEGAPYKPTPKYRLYDREGNEILSNEDKFFNRKWK